MVGMLALIAQKLNENLIAQPGRLTLLAFRAVVQHENPKGYECEGRLA